MSYDSGAKELINIYSEMIDTMDRNTILYMMDLEKDEIIAALKSRIESFAPDKTEK